MRGLHEDGPYGANRSQFSPPFPDASHPVVLTANTLYRHPIPANAAYVAFSFSDTYWAASGLVSDSIAVPSATATTGIAEFCPGQRRIPDGATHILLIAETGCKGSLSFWGGR